MTSIQPDSWAPRTAAELETALSEGLFVEDHNHDFKREIAPRQNKALAIDLASFALDGGLIFVGVEEDKTTRVLSPHPIPLGGLAERITQIGLTSVDPPLLVTVTLLPVSGDSGHGYAVVRVPRSPGAPHQVGGVYRGRGDTTNRTLADTEVRRILAERAVGRARIGELLDQAIASDPIPPRQSQLGHIFIVADPSPPMPSGLVAVLTTGPIRRWIEREGLAQSEGDNWPRWVSFHHALRRPGCWAVSHHELLGSKRVLVDPTRAADVLDVEIHEDGGIRLFAGNGTKREPNGTTFVQEPLIAEHAMRIVDLAGRISREVPYYGGWQFGIAVTGLYGARSITVPPWAPDLDLQLYGGGTYRMTTEASAEEAHVAYREVAKRLVGRLYRDLDRRGEGLPNLARTSW